MSPVVVLFHDVCGEEPRGEPRERLDGPRFLDDVVSFVLLRDDRGPMVVTTQLPDGSVLQFEDVLHPPTEWRLLR